MPSSSLVVDIQSTISLKDALRLKYEMSFDHWIGVGKQQMAVFLPVDAEVTTDSGNTIKMADSWRFFHCVSY